jgi:hypothetical protein
MSKIYSANNTVASAKTAKAGNITLTHEQLQQLIAEAVAKALPQKAAAKIEHCAISADGTVSRPKGEFRLERLRQAGAKWDAETKTHKFSDLAVGAAWVNAENALIDSSIKLFGEAEIKSSNTTKSAAGLEVKIGYVTRIPGQGQKRESVGKVQSALEGLFDAKPMRDAMVISPQNFSDFVNFGGWAMSVR